MAAATSNRRSTRSESVSSNRSTSQTVRKWSTACPHQSCFNWSSKSNAQPNRYIFLPRQTLWSKHPKLFPNTWVNNFRSLKLQHPTTTPGLSIGSERPKTIFVSQLSREIAKYSHQEGEWRVKPPLSASDSDARDGSTENLKTEEVHKFSAKRRACAAKLAYWELA